MTRSGYAMALNVDLSGPFREVSTWRYPLPDPAVIDFSGSDDEPAFRLTLDFSHGSAPRLAEVAVIADDGRAVTARDLRTMRLTDAMQAARWFLDGHRPAPGDIPPTDYSFTDDRSAQPLWESHLVQQYAPPPHVIGRTGLELDPEVAARIKAEGPRSEYTALVVGGIYAYARQSGDSPHKAVQDMLGIGRSAASEWIKFAREYGTVPPSTRKPRADRKPDDA